MPGACPCGTGLRQLEKVHGRFSGFVPVRGKTLRLPDFDEALFPIPELLNFSITVAGVKGEDVLTVETQMLMEADSTALVAQALGALPFIQNLNLQVRCLHQPGEPGSLLKRAIFDQRGQNA